MLRSYCLFVKFDNDFFQLGQLDWEIWYCPFSSSEFKWLYDWITTEFFQELLIECTLSWFGHSYVSGCSIHWTGINYGIAFSECWRKICKYLPSLKKSSIKNYFQKNVSRSWGEKGLCEINYILTCVVRDSHEMQNVSVICWITIEIRLMEYLQYVCGWHSWQKN